MPVFDFSKRGQVLNRTYIPGATTMTVCHRIDTRPVPAGLGPLTTADSVTLFNIPAGKTLRLLRQTAVLRVKSSVDATVKTNAAQTAFAVGPAQAAAVPFGIDGAVATAVVQNLAGTTVDFTVATGTVTGAVVDVYTDVEIYEPVV
jgi:hypothetical protein